MKLLPKIPAPVLLLLPLSILGFSLVRSFLRSPAEAPPPTGPVPVESAPATAAGAPPAAPTGPRLGQPGANLWGEVVAPARVALGDPVEVRLRATNTGTVPLSDVLLWLPLPDHTHTSGGARYFRFNTRELAPGETIERGGTIIATVPGRIDLAARFSSTQTPEIVATAQVSLPTAVLTISPMLSTALAAGQTGSVCFEVRNLGDAPARNVWVRLTEVDSAAINWRTLNPGEARSACFPVEPPAAGPWELAVEASALAADVATLRASVAVAN